MRAAYFDGHGGLDVLRVGEVPTPEPGPGEVRVDVKACALNHLDLWVREGWPGLHLPMPFVGGTDLAGVIGAVGPGVEEVAVGDAVIVNPGLNFAAGPNGDQIIPAEPSVVGETRWGGMGEACVVPATHVLPKPAGLSWAEAAALPLTAQTAMQMIRKARVANGSRVLIIGGGGGVSVMAIQICKALGAWVATTTGGSEKAQGLRDLGADLVLDYRNEAWSKEAFVATEKQGFDVVLDSVGTASWPHSVRALRPGGRLVTCGATTGGAVEMDVRHVFWKQLSILGSTMGTPADLERVLEMVEAGTVRPVVDSTWPLDQVRDAQAHLAAAGQLGKVVLTIS